LIDLSFQRHQNGPHGGRAPLARAYISTASAQLRAKARQPLAQTRCSRRKTPVRCAVTHGVANSFVEVMIAPNCPKGPGNYTDFAARGSLELNNIKRI
jgi:hypothetical protein